MLEQLTALEDEHRELTEKLSDPAFLADRDRFRDASKRLSEITPAVELHRRHRQLEAERAETEQMLGGMSKDD